MPIEVRMPKLSDTMESGTIIRWLKQQGEAVQSGEPLAEVETDKADVEIEASANGVLNEIRIPEGDSAAVGDVIAVLTAPGDAAGTEARSPQKAADAPAAAPPPREREADVAKSEPALRGADGGGRGEKRDTAAPTRATKGGPLPRGHGRDTGEGGRIHAQAVRASPLAWRLANEAGLDLSGVQGSGPGGRIVKRDVEARLRRPSPAAPPSGGRPSIAMRQEDGAHERARPAATESEAEQPEEEAREESRTPGVTARGRLQEQSRMRLTIARRMAEANREIPQFYVTTEVDMSEAVRLRQSLKETGLMSGLTLTHVIVKAVAVALTRHPRVNASWHDGAVEFHDDINVGVAVAVEDGLIVPVLHRAQQLGIAEISVRVRGLTEKARSGRFSGQDLTGATFSVSNLGILDVDEFTAVISPPQAAILAVGAVKEQPVVRNGQLAIARTMRMTLSCDHRVLNGVEGGRFLEEVKRLLEMPVVLVVSGAEDQ